MLNFIVKITLTIIGLRNLPVTVLCLLQIQGKCGVEVVVQGRKGNRDCGNWSELNSPMVHSLSRQSCNVNQPQSALSRTGVGIQSIQAFNDAESP